MATLAEFKEQNPAYKDVPDQELAIALHKKYYSNIPENEFYQKIGLTSESKIGRGEAALKTTLQGATLGFADEATAGIAAAGAKAFGGEATKDISLKDLYKEARSTEREKLAQAREAYPIQSFVTEVTGSLPSTIGIIEKAGLAGKGIKTAAKGAGLVGAIQGLGDTEDLTNIPQTIKDVALNSGISALGGAAAEGLIAGGKIAGTSVANVAKRLTGGREAESILKNVINPEEAAQLVGKLERSDTQGRNLIVPDIAGDEVAGLTRLLAKTSGSKQIINEALNKRTATSSKKVANLINSKISAESYLGNADDIIKAREELSAPLYKKVQDEFGNIPTMSDIRSRQINQLPVSKLEIERANKFQKFTEDSRIKKAYQDAKKNYGIGDAPINSFTALDGIKKALGDVAGESKRSGASEKTREFTSLKHQLVNFLDEVNPDYKIARQTYAGKSELLDSQEIGLNFNKEFKNSEELKRYLKDLTPGEKDTFKIGVARNLLNTVGNTPDESSAARRIFGKPENREKLKAIFDNPKEYMNFARKMNDEIRVFKTKQRILGGSRTDINLKDEEEVINKVAKGLVAPKIGLTNAVMDSLKKRYIGLNDANAKQLAQILTSRQKSIEALKKIAAKADPEQRKIIIKSYQDILPIMAGAQAGKLTTETKE